MLLEHYQKSTPLPLIGIVLSLAAALYLYLEWNKAQKEGGSS